MQKIELVLSKKSREYKAGDILSGCLKCTFIAPTRIEHATVAVFGQERTLCNEGFECELESVRLWYSETDLLQGRSSSQHNVNKGSYSYQFQFVLPATLPSSFEMNHVGRISYMAEAVFVSEDRRIAKEDFVVKSPIIDLNVFPNGFKDHYSDLVEHHVKMLKICDLGSVKITVDFHKRLFAFSEPIKFSLTVDTRQFKTTINKIRVHGEGVICYRHSSRDERFFQVRYPTKMDTVQTVTKGVHGPGVHLWNISIDIPEVDIPNFQTCKLFDFFYVLDVKMDMGFCRKLTANAKVQLGHVRKSAPFS